MKIKLLEKLLQFCKKFIIRKLKKNCFRKICQNQKIFFNKFRKMFKKFRKNVFKISKIKNFQKIKILN